MYHEPEILPIQLVKELLDVKNEKLEVPGITLEDVDQIIEEICCN